MPLTHHGTQKYSPKTLGSNGIKKLLIYRPRGASKALSRAWTPTRCRGRQRQGTGSQENSLRRSSVGRQADKDLLYSPFNKNFTEFSPRTLSKHSKDKTVFFNLIKVQNVKGVTGQCDVFKMENLEQPLIKIYKPDSNTTSSYHLLITHYQALR